MRSDSSVVADAAAGAAFVAGARIPMSAAGAAGELRFGGPRGSVLRTLTFGERTELVSSASTTDEIAAGILSAATLERGDGAAALLEVLAMWLAGADFDAPGYLETTLLVARAAGWQPQDLFAAPAREIDRIAVQLGEPGDWKSLVFAEAPAETIESVRERFAERLLRRGGGMEAGERDGRWNGSVTEAAALEREERDEGRASARPRIPAPAVERGLAQAGPALRASAAEAGARQAVPLVRGVRVLVPHPQEVRGGTRVAMAAGEQSREVAAVPAASASTAAAQPVWSAAAALPLSHAWLDGEGADEERGSWGGHGGRRDAARAAGGDAGGPAGLGPVGLGPAGSVRWGERGARRRDAAGPAGEDAGAPHVDAGAPHVHGGAPQAGAPNELAAILAAWLDDEADLRGVAR